MIKIIEGAGVQIGRPIKATREKQRESANKAKKAPKQEKKKQNDEELNRKARVRREERARIEAEERRHEVKQLADLEKTIQSADTEVEMETLADISQDDAGHAKKDVVRNRFLEVDPDWSPISLDQHQEPVSSEALLATKMNRQNEETLMAFLRMYFRNGAFRRDGVMADPQKPDEVAAESLMTSLTDADLLAIRRVFFGR